MSRWELSGPSLVMCALFVERSGIYILFLHCFVNNVYYIYITWKLKVTETGSDKLESDS